MKPRILIIEDEPAISKGLCDVFVFHGFEVDTAEDGLTGLKKSLTGNFHLIILDVMLPEMNGFTVCEEVRKKDRSLPIIMLTAKSTEDDIIAGLKLGADDYIPKPFSVRELVARAEAVLRRSPKLSLDNKTLQWGPFMIDAVNLRVTQNETLVEMTRREIEILLYLIKHKERPISRQELLKEVWGYANSNMDTRTVDIHMAKLRKKIEQDPLQPKWIQTIRSAGYKIGNGKA